MVDPQNGDLWLGSHPIAWKVAMQLEDGKYPAPSHVSTLSWWRHQIETFFELLAICAGNSLVTGEFPAQRPVARSFDVFFDLRLK